MQRYVAAMDTVWAITANPTVGSVETPSLTALADDYVTRSFVIPRVLNPRSPIIGEPTTASEAPWINMVCRTMLAHVMLYGANLRSPSVSDVGSRSRGFSKLYMQHVSLGDSDTSSCTNESSCIALGIAARSM